MKYRGAREGGELRDWALRDVTVVVTGDSMLSDASQCFSFPTQKSAT